jgi:recombinational DNA repair protein (RecF pathway)
MRHFRTEGIIIKRRNFGEADRILTVLTRDYGKITIKAAGVRKITSRRSAHVELLNHTSLHLYKGKTFAILTEARVIDDFSAIKIDFQKVGIAYHLCELIDGLCPENQENRPVFFLLQKMLQSLAQLKEHAFPTQFSSESDDYTIGTFGIDVGDAPRMIVQDKQSSSQVLDHFERALLSELGYADRQGEQMGLLQKYNTHTMIENILEKKLKSRSMFAKLQ